jgi:hypothetical protein
MADGDEVLRQEWAAFSRSQGSNDPAVAFGAGFSAGERHAAQQAWVSVEERLPEAPDRVLLAHPDFATSVGHWTGKEWDSDNWHSTQPRETFTHWMPLPSPQTKETT